MSFFENTRKPVGLGGKIMVAMMNLGHSPVARWGIHFLELTKVSSSHSKGETVILSQAPLDENALRTAIDATGYMAGEISTAVYEKKGFFHFGKKKH